VTAPDAQPPAEPTDEQRHEWNQQCADLRMDAYYYGFDGTGVRAVDLILSAVAYAGKAAHHTEFWVEEPCGGGPTPAERIQRAADAAAAEFRAASAALDGTPATRADHDALADELFDLARRVESEAEIAARPGQLDRLDAIANRLRSLGGLQRESASTPTRTEDPT
jgi:hypothetical protein